MVMRFLAVPSTMSLMKMVPGPALLPPCAASVPSKRYSLFSVTSKAMRPPDPPVPPSLPFPPLAVMLPVTPCSLGVVIHTDPPAPPPDNRVDCPFAPLTARLPSCRKYSPTMMRRAPPPRPYADAPVPLPPASVGWYAEPNTVWSCVVKPAWKPPRPSGPGVPCGFSATPLM